MTLVDTINSKAESIYLTDFLEKNNIPFIQKSEDGGGKYGSLIFSSGVKIFVSDEDIDKVQNLIYKADD